MCLSKRCCFYVQLESGCLLIGILTLVVSLGICISCSVMLAAEESKRLVYMHEATQHFLSTFHLDVNRKSKNLILSIVVLIAVLKMATSGVLIVGVKKGRAGFILLYFAFGVFVTAFLLSGALLLLLKNCWWISFALTGASLLNIHFLVVVHSFYERLVSGREIGSQTHYLPEFDDTELLITETTP